MALLMIALAWPMQAQNWPQWRGPEFTGATTEAVELPERFGPEENVKWVVDLPGASAATPVVWGDRVFVSSVDEASAVLLAMCFDAETGRLLWQREMGPGISRDRRSNYAAPSPATDGRTVWFFYSTGKLAALTMEGEPRWERNIQEEYGEFAFLWTFSSSPMLYEGRLYLQVLQRDVAVSGRGRRDGPNDSYLLALNPETGREYWRQLRASEARQESREAFSTPIPFDWNGAKEILVAGGDCITGHDAATGTELWRWGTWNPGRITHWRLVPSPVAGGGVILACAPKG
ncbi:MAG TPA: PQQ-binding-like beta-propeller repeat protein, partial [Desulfosarcina sp.]|nr:PQQ-binding-like beta-propeller repeat protein [Desulfosarcina sp.]